MTLLPHETPPVGKAAAMAARIAAEIPVIETERLVLRAPRLEDFPALAEIECGPRGKYIGGPMSREGCWGDFVQIVANWMLHGHGFWSVDDAETGGLLGFVGIGFEPGDREPELGWLLSEAAEGRGIATEAATAARDFAWTALGFTMLVSYIDKANTRSVALARRLGAVEDTPADWDEPDTIVFRHHAEVTQ